MLKKEYLQYGGQYVISNCNQLTSTFNYLWTILINSGTYVTNNFCLWIITDTHTSSPERCFSVITCWLRLQWAPIPWEERLRSISFCLFCCLTHLHQIHFLNGNLWPCRVLLQYFEAFQFLCGTMMNMNRMNKSVAVLLFYFFYSHIHVVNYVLYWCFTFSFQSTM